jgi:non-ribosomal peptide synthetase component F
LEFAILQKPSDLSQTLSECHLRAFGDIVGSILSDRNQTISQAIRVGEADLKQLWEWNRVVPPAINTCIHDLFVANAKQNPDHQAVVSWDGELTYGDVEEYSTQLAVHMVGLGIGVGSAVLLCFEKSMWTVVAVLATMKAGGALVLTDPSQPEARLQTMATEAKVSLIITSRKQAELGKRISSEVRQLTVEGELFKRGELSTGLTLPTVRASATLYIIFTSGSTGKPKGVVISHSNYTSGALPRAEAVGYKSHSRVLDFPSYAFDVSIDCMLCTLAHGGCICVPSDDARINNLSGAIRDMQVNMAHMTPSVARVLDPDIMPSLEVLGLGGESISASDASSWRMHH